MNIFEDYYYELLDEFKQILLEFRVTTTGDYIDMFNDFINDNEITDPIIINELKKIGRTKFHTEDI